MTGGVLTIGVGVWMLCQVFGGDALTRLGLLKGDTADTPTDAQGASGGGGLDLSKLATVPGSVAGGAGGLAGDALGKIGDLAGDVGGGVVDKGGDVLGGIRKRLFGRFEGG